MGWQQRPDGEWAARVALDVPQAAVRPREGQDYTQVPRTVQYVLAVDTRFDPPREEIHSLGCWMINDTTAHARVTPLPAADMAVTMLKLPHTKACTGCRAADLAPSSS